MKNRKTRSILCIAISILLILPCGIAFAKSKGQGTGNSGNTGTGKLINGTVNTENGGSYTGPMYVVSSPASRTGYIATGVPSGSNAPSGRTFPADARRSGGGGSSKPSGGSGGGNSSGGNSIVSAFYAAGGDDGATVDFGTVDQGGTTPSCHDYTVPVSAPDYEVAEAGPSVMRKGYQALVYVNVKNIGQLTGKANVSVKINGEVIGDMTTITIPAGGTHTISYGHYTPRTTGKIQMEVMVNPNHPTSTAPRTTTVNSCYGGGYTLEYGSKGELSPAEYSYSNNKLTQNILVSKYPDVPIVTVDAPRPPALTEFISKLPEIDVSPTNDWPDEYGGLELTAEAARFYTSGRARFTPPGGHILQ